MKKIVIKTAVAMLMFMIPGLAASGGSITHTVTFNSSPVFDTSTLGGVTYTTVVYPGLSNIMEPGMPSLPIDYIRFSVPWNATGFSITTICSESSKSCLEHPVIPCHNPDEGEALLNPVAYSAGASYPAHTAWVVNEGVLAGENRIVTVAVIPITYIHDLAGDTLHIMESVNLTLTYELSTSLDSYPLVRRDTTLRNKGFELVRSIVVNPDDVRSNAIQPSGNPMFCLPQYQLDSIDNPATYLIVTTDELLHSMRRLAALKMQKGLNVKIVTMADVFNDPISSDGDYFYSPVDEDSTLIYSDDAGKLRQYIKSHYLLFGTEYVLLAGNGVPYRLSSTAQTDQYFSDINAPWRWGAFDYGELAVGRLLGTTPHQFENYTDKLLRYELNPGSGNRSYLGRALALESTTNYTLVEYIWTLGNVFNDVNCMNPETDGYQLTGCGLLDSIGNVNYGFFSSLCDAFPSGMKIYEDVNEDVSHYLWAIDSVKTAPEVSDLESGNGLNRLENRDYPMICFAPHGQTMPFNHVDGYGTDVNFGTSFTMGEDYGGPSFIGLTDNVNFFNSYQFSMSLADEWNEGNTILGKSIMEAKWGLDIHVHEHAIKAYNYLGDPALDMWTSAPQFYSGVTVSRTDNGVSVSGIGGQCKTIAYHSNDGTTGSVESSSSSVSLNGISPNSTIMVYDHNHIPYIAPLVVQNTDLSCSQYVIAGEVTAGRSVDNGRTNGDVTVKSGANYEIEAAGEVTLAGGFSVEKGAGFAVRGACF